MPRRVESGAGIFDRVRVGSAGWVGYVQPYVWGVIGAKDAAQFFMNALPGMFEKIEILEGDGGVGTVLRIIYPEGSVPLTNEEKFVTMDDCKRLKEILQTKEGYLDMGVTYYMETFKIIECGNSSIIQSIVEYKAPEEVAAKVSSLISVEVLALFNKFRVTGYLDGSRVWPPQFTSRNHQNNDIVNRAYTTWQDEDSTIILLLNSLISDVFLPYVAGATSAHEFRTNLSTRFSQASATHTIQLRTQLQSLKLGNGSIQTYLNSIKKIVDALDVADILLLQMRGGYNSAPKGRIAYHSVHRGVYSFSPRPAQQFSSVPPPSSFKNAQPPCQTCKEDGHLAPECTNRLNFSYQGRQPPANCHVPGTVVFFGTRVVYPQSLVLALFNKFRVTGYLDGSRVWPPQFTSRNHQNNDIVNRDYTTWQDEDSTIILLLNSLISDVFLPYVAGATSAHEFWTNLSTRFSQASATHTIQLRTQLKSLKLGNGSIQTYVNSIKKIVDALDVADILLLQMRGGYNSAPRGRRAYHSVHRGVYSFSPRPAQQFSSVPPPSSFKNAQPPCQTCKEDGHLAPECTNRLNFSYQGRQPPANCHVPGTVVFFGTRVVYPQSLVLALFNKFRVTGYLDGSRVWPPQFTSRNHQNNDIVNRDYTTWQDEDSTIILLLNSLISDVFLPYVAGATSAHEFWTNLSTRFSQASATHTIQLRTQLKSLKLGNGSIQTYVNSIKKIVDALDVADILLLQMRGGYNSAPRGRRAYHSVHRGVYSFSPRPAQQFASVPPPSSFKNAQPPCQTCKEDGHLAPECTNRLNFSYQERQPPANCHVPGTSGLSSIYLSNPVIHPVMYV
ncbi:hypothetical protein C5167_032441 [Papaver somniferum]|uniref:CCHC-type domain-containing protein n=1 Tax=Papaver somniferum TaxID=3469 RepID=A0A4Y7K579_PAPSO|nr:hypothetical protein C5167_032441 [Papaver somniferum]